MKVTAKDVIRNNAGNITGATLVLEFEKTVRQSNHTTKGGMKLIEYGDNKGNYRFPELGFAVILNCAYEMEVAAPVTATTENLAPDLVAAIQALAANPGLLAQVNAAVSGKPKARGKAGK